MAYRLMGTPPFDAAMKCKDKRRSFGWERAIGPNLPRTGTAMAFAAKQPRPASQKQPRSETDQ
jgi:hypothetical protein